MGRGGVQTIVWAIIGGFAVHPAVARTVTATLMVTAYVPGSCAVSVAPRDSAATISLRCRNTPSQAVGIAAGGDAGIYTGTEARAADASTRTLIIHRSGATAAAGRATLLITY